VKNICANTSTSNRATATGSSRETEESGPTVGRQHLESGGQIICSLLSYLALFKP